MEEPGPPFTPPFCPQPTCRFHHNPRSWRFKRDGFHWRAFDRRRVQRYRCHQCRRSFSSQTFSTTYWLKRPDILDPVLRALLSCSAFRQIARALEIAPSTVALHAARVGRHMLLWAEQHRPRTPPTEPLVLDGFETFEFSKYWVTHLNLVVGAESHSIYACNAAELRRKGRMTSAQKRRRHQLEARYGRPDLGALELRVAEVLSLVLPAGSAAVLRSDEHPAYVRALRRLADRSIRHETTAGSTPFEPTRGAEEKPSPARSVALCE